MPRGTETIVVKPLGDTDWQGDPVGAPASREIKGCIVWPVTETDRPDRILDSRGIFIPPEATPPDVLDSIHYDGEDWEIDGNIGPQRTPKGKLKGYIFSITRVAGGES